MTLSFIVPGPPVGKGRPRFTRTGHAYTPEKTRVYEAMVRASYEAQCGTARLEGPVFARIIATFKAPRRGKKEWQTGRPDADNVAKAVLDAIGGVAFHDDAQVAELEVFKWYGPEPCVFVILAELEGGGTECP